MIVAEGVEGPANLDHLQGMNAHMIQGYYLSRPIPGIELTEWLGQRPQRNRVPLHIVQGNTA